MTKVTWRRSAAISCVVEHMMIAREVFGRAEAQDAQGRADRALARRQDHAGDQDEQMAPDGGGEEPSERLHQRGQARRQGLCHDRFVGTMMFGHRKVGIPLRLIVISAPGQ